MSVSVCPVLEQLSRAPCDRPRPRDCAMPAPHGTRSYGRKNGPQRQPRLAGSVERSRPRSPIWREKTWKSQYDAATQPPHESTHVLLPYVLLHCCTYMVGRWFGCCRCCFCCRTAAVVRLCIPTPNSTCGERRKDPSSREIVKKEHCSNDLCCFTCCCAAVHGGWFGGWICG